MIDDALKLTVDVLFPPVYPEIDNKSSMSNFTNSPNKNSTKCENSNEQIKDCNSKSTNNLSGNNNAGINGNAGNSGCNSSGIRPSLFPVDGYSSESMFSFLLNLNKHQ